MTKPKTATDLTPNQALKYDQLLLKEDRTEKDEETLEVLRKKKERFLNPELSEIAKKHLIDRYSKERYNKRNAPYSAKMPMVAKGTALEEEAINLLSEFHKVKYIRQEESVKNDFLHGRCDILCEDGKNLVEVKTSWSAVSFFPKVYHGLHKKTWFQMQGYLELYNLDIGKICYVLVNTPRHLIEQEYANLFKKYTFGEITIEKFEEGLESIDGFYNYDNISLKRRIIEFEVHRCPELIAMVRKRVDLCRSFLNEFEVKHMKNKKIITLAEDFIKTNAEENHSESDPGESY